MDARVKPGHDGGCHSGMRRKAQTRNPEVIGTRFQVRVFDAPRNDGIGISYHTSSVTVTGTWSDGRSQPRASRVILKSLTLSLRERDTQM